MEIKKIYLKRVQEKIKISSNVSMTRVNMESKNLKTVRKNVGMKLINKSNRITSAAFDSFQHTIENGNRSSIRKINDMLDSLGDQAGKKK